MNNILSKEEKEINTILNKEAFEKMSQFDDISQFSSDSLLSEAFDKVFQNDDDYYKKTRKEDEQPSNNIADEQLKYLKTLN